MKLAEEMVDWFLKLEPIGPDVEVKVEGGMNRPPYTKDAGITDLFQKAQAIYREIGKELNDVLLTGGGSDGNFTAALGIPTLDGLGADGKGAHAAYEQIYYSSLVPRTYLCTRLLETLEYPENKAFSASNDRNRRLNARRLDSRYVCLFDVPSSPRRPLSSWTQRRILRSAQDDRVRAAGFALPFYFLI